MWASLGIPVVFTEDNWSTNLTPNSIGNTNCKPGGSTPTSQADIRQAEATCEGAYLVDLATWLTHHPSDSNSYRVYGSSPIRIAWFRGLAGADGLLGVYNDQQQDKTFPVTQCPLNGQVAGSNSSMANDYSVFALGGYCY